MTRPTGYTRTQIFLHWAVAALVAAQFLFAASIADAYDTARTTGAVTVSALVVAHLAGGALILLLACWRLILRGDRGTPPPPPGEPARFRKLAHATHLGFYVLLILLPLSGALAWGGGIEAAARAHAVLRVLLLVLIAAHLGAVALHQFVWKTGLLARMLTPQA